MSEDAVVVPSPAPSSPPSSRAFLRHAKLIGVLTLLSRIVGMGREIASAHYFGAGIVSSAFTVAFAVPNLFRKLFGEGALSAAFIPLYAQALKNDSPESARNFAAASVNLLGLILLFITILGEAVIGAIIFFYPDLRPDYALTLKFSAVMLPYVLLICSTAFLGSILQVHKRFAAPAAAPILLNVIHIVVLVLGGWFFKLQFTKEAQLVSLQIKLAYWLSFFVLVAGVLQILMLLPSLRAVGFRFTWIKNFWTPAVKRMLLLSVPVALGAGVLQLSVLMDKGISIILAQGSDHGNLINELHILGYTIRCPMELGAAARLNWAQFLYQFPLGIFAIALATAIFPGLSSHAMDSDRREFRSILRQGIEATLFEGFAASAGLIIVRYPAIRLFFQHGYITAHDADLIARSTLWYATGIWAFSLLQIINRAYYALHDTKTPLVMAIVNILLNLIVELPLVWTGLGEAGMAVGTSVSFAIQAIVMLIMLDRRVGGLELKKMLAPIGKMLLATLAMCIVCYAVQKLPFYPTGPHRTTWAIQLAILMTTGAGVYFAVCAALGLGIMEHLKPKRK
jgi:putative peptidoglycan lipid II flippase